MKEYTVSTFADELGVSWNSVYKAGKEYFPDKQWGKNVVLNGTTETLLNHYTNSSKSTTANKAKKLLSMVSDSTEIKEPDSMKSTVEIKAESKRIQPKVKSEIKKESIVEAPKESIVEVNETAIKKSWIQKVLEFDLGRAILSSPFIRFVFVTAMVFAQAFMFASLEQKVLNGMNLYAPFKAAFAVGVIFEFAGFMIASTFKGSKGLGWGKREWWLFFITCFQFGTNYFLLEPHAAESIMIGFGRGMICLSVPAGLMAYSFLYFKE